MNSKTLPNTYKNRVAEYKKSQESSVENSAPSACPQNPYRKAREMIFSKLSAWRKEEILKMEKNKDVNNRFYSDFVNEVIQLGDSLTN